MKKRLLKTLRFPGCLWIVAFIALSLGGWVFVLAEFTTPSKALAITGMTLAIIAVVVLARVWLSARLNRPEIVYRAMAKRYGVGYGDLNVECHIAPNGSATVRRRVVVEAFSVMDQLDTFLLVPESNADDSRHVSHVSIDSMTDSHKLLLARRREAGAALSSVISISPPLGEGESCTYILTEQLPPGLYAVDISEEALSKRKTPYDYFGWSISRPTRRLSLKVHFPPGLVPEDYGGAVHYTAAAPGLPSQRQQREEEKRIGGPFLELEKNESYVLRLDADYPMIGLIYVLRWQPAQVLGLTVVPKS